MKPKKLSESPQFRIALLLPLILGATLFITSALTNQNFKICLSSDCVNYFFELYKYPLSIIGLAVPLTAITAALHRSEEASHQIEETLKQNTFNNYIKHKEEFIDVLEKLEITCACKFTDPLNTYKNIFPLNNYSSFNFKSQWKQHPSDNKPAQDNELLDFIRSELDGVMALIYAPNMDSFALRHVIYSIDEITDALRIKRTQEPFHQFSQSRLVWPTDYAKTSTMNLFNIVRTLELFSFHDRKQTEKKQEWNANMTLPNSGQTKQRNMELVNELAEDVSALF